MRNQIRHVLYTDPALAQRVEDHVWIGRGFALVDAGEFAASEREWMEDHLGPQSISDTLSRSVAPRRHSCRGSASSAPRACPACVLPVSPVIACCTAKTATRCICWRWTYSLRTRHANWRSASTVRPLRDGQSAWTLPASLPSTRSICPPAPTQSNGPARPRTSRPVSSRWLSTAWPRWLPPLQRELHGDPRTAVADARPGDFRDARQRSGPASGNSPN